MWWSGDWVRAGCVVVWGLGEGRECGGLGTRLYSGEVCCV